MTEAQLKLLDFIREEIALRGVAPSFGRMAEQLGHASKSSVHRMIEALVSQGLLVRRGSVGSRTLALPGADLRSVSTAALQAELARRGLSWSDLQPDLNRMVEVARAAPAEVLSAARAAAEERSQAQTAAPSHEGKGRAARSSSRPQEGGEVA